MCYGSSEEKERSCLEISEARTTSSWQDQIAQGIVQRIGQRMYSIQEENCRRFLRQFFYAIRPFLVRSVWE